MRRSYSKEKQVNIAKLKIHLGQYLKLVREGEEVIILDRQTPVAKLVSYAPTFDLSIESIPPKKTWAAVLDEFQASDKKLKPKQLKKSAQNYLQEDRGDK